MQKKAKNNTNVPLVKLLIAKIAKMMPKYALSANCLIICYNWKVLIFNVWRSAQKDFFKKGKFVKIVCRFSSFKLSVRKLFNIN